MPILKLHSILAVANLLAHNNISQICYCGQISLQSAAVISAVFLITLEVTFILLAMVHATSACFRSSRDNEGSPAWRRAKASYLGRARGANPKTVADDDDHTL